MTVPPPPIVSYVVPAHNAGRILPRTVPVLVEHLVQIGGGEIIIVENGSTDGTWDVAARLAGEPLTGGVVIRAARSDKGMGHAYRQGVAESTGRLVVCTAADIPFGLTDLEALLALGVPPERSVFVGSKRHAASVIGRRPILRSTMTLGFAGVRRLLLKTPVRDTQGTLLVPGDFARTVLPMTRERGFLITAEIIEIAHRSGVVAVELPVTFPADDAPSSVKAIRDSWEMVRGLRRIAANAASIAERGGLIPRPADTAAERAGDRSAW